MTTLLTLPAKGYQLFWNGYMSPYSNAGHDWMDGAEYVMPQNQVTEELQELVDEYMFHYRQLHDKKYTKPVNPPSYIAYIQNRLYKYERQLLALGYTVKVS